jgi:hypothetical protein
MVSWPVCLAWAPGWNSWPDCFFSLCQLRVSWCGRWVCNLLVKSLLGLARAVTLRSKSRRTHCHILLSHLRLLQPGGPGPCVYIPVPWLNIQVQVILRPTVSRPVCLGVGPPSGAHDQICITVGHLQSSCWGATSLTGGQVCNLLVQFDVTLRSKSLRTHCLIWDSLNLEGQVPVFIFPMNRVAQLHIRALGSLSVTSYNSQGCCGSILTHLHTG